MEIGLKSICLPSSADILYTTFYGVNIISSLQTVDFSFIAITFSLIFKIYLFVFIVLRNLEYLNLK